MNAITTILVTVGADFHNTLVVDNLSNASAESLKRVAQLAGRVPRLVEGDIRDRAFLDHVLAEHPVQTVLHFVGLKAVGESVVHALDYFINNVGAPSPCARPKQRLNSVGLPSATLLR